MSRPERRGRVRLLQSGALGSYEMIGNGDWWTILWDNGLEADFFKPLARGLVEVLPPVMCSTGCRREATHSFGGEVLCLRCVEVAMEFGHKHTHDEPEDCHAEVDRLDGKGFTRVACAVPL